MINTTIQLCIKQVEHSLAVGKCSHIHGFRLTDVTTSS